MTDAKEKNMIHLVTSGAVDVDALDKEFENLNQEEEALKAELAGLEAKTETTDEQKYTLMAIGEELSRHGERLEEYDDVTVRKTIECIRVMSKTEISIIFKGGFEVIAEVEK